MSFSEHDHDSLLGWDKEEHDDAALEACNKADQLHRPSTQNPRWQGLLSLGLNIILSLLCIGLSVNIASSASRHDTKPDVFPCEFHPIATLFGSRLIRCTALLKSYAFRYERRKFHVDIHNSPFAGSPRPELDAAWHGLFESACIQLANHPNLI